MMKHFDQPGRFWSDRRFLPGFGALQGTGLVAVEPDHKLHRLIYANAFGSSIRAAINRAKFHAHPNFGALR